jgi:MacB-like periplasmic core domain
MGRALNNEDDASTRRVAVVNEAFAQRFFAKENPIGQHFGPAPAANAGTYEIVGVAGDLARDGSSVRDGMQPIYFVPEAQSATFAEADLEAREVWSHDLYNVVLWAPGNPPDLGAEVKSTLAEIDPDLVLYGVQPYAEVVRNDFAQENTIASLTWLFGMVGLVLAAVGLYGVTAYGVEQRTSEIGMRMALGADRGSVVAMVLRGAFLEVGIGLMLGIPAAIGAGHLMASRLFGVRAWDPVMLGGAAVVLGLAALAAAAIPARRAVKIEPMQALRAE